MKHLELIELRETYITSKSGKVASVEEATPEEFDEWILQYIRITNVEQNVWPLVMRKRAINFAIDENVPLRFVDKEGKLLVTDKRPDTHVKDANPIEKKEDLPGGEENISRVPSGGA